MLDYILDACLVRPRPEMDEPESDEVWASADDEDDRYHSRHADGEDIWVYKPECYEEEDGLT